MTFIIFFLNQFSLVLPIFIPGIIFIVFLKNNWLKTLRIPIDGGKKFLNQPIFGNNKTWLGIFVYVLGSLILCFVLNLFSQNILINKIFQKNFINLSLVYSLGYVTGELINSFIKRRLKINIGEISRKNHLLQRFFDLTDGTIVVVTLLVVINWLSICESVFVFIIAFVIHLSTDLLMKKLQMKKF